MDSDRFRKPGGAKKSRRVGGCNPDAMVGRSRRSLFAHMYVYIFLVNCHVPKNIAPTVLSDYLFESTAIKESEMFLAH